MAIIHVIDDEVGIRELLSEILTDEGHTVRVADSAAGARELRQRERPDLALLDIWMPDTDGLSLLKEWAANGQLAMPVLMMSGHGTIDTAVEAVRIGAADFLEKPIALQKLLAAVSRVLAPRDALPAPGASFAAIGRTPALVDVKRRLAQLAASPLSVLLRGPAGAAPELFARILHASSAPWVNAGTSLADAPNDLLTQAAGGTLFVEELAMFAKGQQRGLAYIAERAERHKVRLVTFTSYPIESLADERGFDPALLARLSGVVVRLPALAEYADDIPEIAEMLLAELVKSGRSPARKFSAAALAALRGEPWRRDLESLAQAVRTAALTSLGEEIEEADVARVLADERAANATPGAGLPLDLPLREARELFERAYFAHHLAREQGSISRVAEKSGLERTHLYRKLKQLGIFAGRKEA